MTSAHSKLAPLNAQTRHVQTTAESCLWTSTPLPPPHKPNSHSKNLQTKNAFSSARRGGASGAASRATWPENVQDEHHARIRLRLFAQTKPRPPKVRNRWTKNLQPQFEPQQWDPNSRKHSKLQQSKNQWMMKKGGCTWMPEIWARIFTMSSPNGRGLDN